MHSEVVLGSVTSPTVEIKMISGLRFSRHTACCMLSGKGRIR
ncbi:hypothetical protein B712_0434 [Chlamydia psittaci NJ1]|nr:hypothetical protein B712_0434 [Chlamydia psittaci NJ1]